MPTKIYSFTVTVSDSFSIADFQAVPVTEIAPLHKTATFNVEADALEDAREVVEEQAESFVDEVLAEFDQSIDRADVDVSIEFENAIVATTIVPPSRSLGQAQGDDR